MREINSGINGLKVKNSKKDILDGILLLINDEEMRNKFIENLKLENKSNKDLIKIKKYF